MKNVWQRIILQDYNVINITKVEVQLLFILGFQQGPRPLLLLLYTVDLVISACFHFREFVILKKKIGCN